jgi:hypothetical protein
MHSSRRLATLEAGWALASCVVCLYPLGETCALFDVSPKGSYSGFESFFAIPTFPSKRISQQVFRCPGFFLIGGRFVARCLRVSPATGGDPAREADYWERRYGVTSDGHLGSHRGAERRSRENSAKSNEESFPRMRESSNGYCGKVKIGRRAGAGPTKTGTLGNEQLAYRSDGWID